METISLTRLNELFQKLDDLSTVGKTIMRNERDYEEIDTILQTKEGLYVKVVKERDSYGGEDRLISIQFVEPKIKSITDYEPIKQ